MTRFRILETQAFEWPFTLRMPSRVSIAMTEGSLNTMPRSRT